MPCAGPSANGCGGMGESKLNSSCSVELLKSALVGELPPEREETLHRHLDECEACVAALEQMAGGEAGCREVAAY